MTPELQEATMFQILLLPIILYSMYSIYYTVCFKVETIYIFLKKPKTKTWNENTVYIIG